MNEHHHSSGSNTLYLFSILATLGLFAVVKLLKGRSKAAAQLHAWLQKPKNRSKFQNWFLVGFFFVVFGGLTLFYELTH